MKNEMTKLAKTKKKKKKKKKYPYYFGRSKNIQRTRFSLSSILIFLGYITAAKNKNW